MTVYITYDAHNGRADIKPALIKAGFKDRWVGDNNQTYYLPNTSLWHHNINDVEMAKKLFFETIYVLNSERSANDKIIIERFIAVPANPWSGIQGEKHA